MVVRVGSWQWACEASFAYRLRADRFCFVARLFLDPGWPPELSALDDGLVHDYSGSMHGAVDVDAAFREPRRYQHPASSGFAETAPPPPPPPPPPRHHDSPPPTGAPTALVGAAAEKADAGGRERVQQQQRRRRGLQPRPDASFNLPASDAAHPAPQVQQVTVQQSDLFEQLDANQDHVIQSNEIQQVRVRWQAWLPAELAVRMARSISDV